MKAKWAKLSVAVFGVGSMLQLGCLGLGDGDGGGFFGGFVDGIFGRGFPTNNLWLNIGIDVLNEELFG
jgi:hypothetical protein